MTAPKLTLYNTLEQILSADMNRTGGLAGKAAMDVALFVAANQLLTTPRDLVLRGLGAAPGAGLTVDVSPGAIAVFDAGAGVDNSPYQLGELAATTNVVLGAADPVNPRVDIIYGTPSSTDTDSTIRNILTLPSRVVTPTLVDKTRQPAMTLGVAAGTPAATILDAQLGAVPAGSVPLWYVFVPASAVSLTAAELADARAQFNPASVLDAHMRKFGFLLSRGPTTTSHVRIGSGEAYVNGAHVRHDATSEFLASDIFEVPAGVLLQDTEYPIYIVGRGSGDPVGDTVAQDFIPVIDPGNTPNEDGKPSVAMVYRPWRAIHDEARFTPANPLYIGTMLSIAAGFQESGGYPMSKGGTRPLFGVRGLGLGVAGFGGGVSPGILTDRPPIEWVDASNVTVGRAIFALNGVPVLVNSQTLNMPGDLISGADSANTFYYVYARCRKAASTVVTSLSQEGIYVLSPTAPNADGGLPSPQAGFSSFEYCYVGAVFNNASSDFQQFRRAGDRVYWDATNVGQFVLFSAEPTVFAGLDTITAFTPNLPSGRHAILTIGVLASGAYATTAFFVRPRVGSGINQWVFDQSDYPAGVSVELQMNDTIELEVDPTTSQFQTTIDLASGAGQFDVVIYQRGFIDPIKP